MQAFYTCFFEILLGSEQLHIFDNLLNFFFFLQNSMSLSLLANYLYYCSYIISIDLELF